MMQRLFARRWWRRLVLPLWLTTVLALISAFILSPALWPTPARGLRLGMDVPMLALADAGGNLGVEQVAALPDSAFETLHAPLSHGYTRDVYWLKVQWTPGVTTFHDSLWLEILPSYLDRVTLYQQSNGSWHARSDGDTLPPGSRVPVRQLMFPLAGDAPFLLRIQTTSPMQFDGTVWHYRGLLGWLSSVEWASGVHQGINLVLALLIAGAALVLRLRSLVAMAVAAATVLLHGAADRGYLLLWLPASLTHWSDLGVKLGTLLLPTALSWQCRELLTRGTAWRRLDAALRAAGWLPALCVPSIWLGRYEDCAWIGIAGPWIISILFSIVAWSNLLRYPPTLERVLMTMPATLYCLLGLYVTAAYLGMAHMPPIETSVLWQLTTLLIHIVITVAVGTGLIQRFRASMLRQRRLVRRHTRTEQALEARVRQRTDELLQAQNALQLALHRERELRLAQRQFFRTMGRELHAPLLTMDGVAAEQQSHPSRAAQVQQQRALHMRRACRHLSTLVDNCLLSDRLDAGALQPRWSTTPIPDVLDEVAHAAALHPLRVDAHPALPHWRCDAELLRVALCNLVDLAARHAGPHEIALQAGLDAQGDLEFSVSVDGIALPPDLDPGSLGLLVAQRIAWMHGGTVRLDGCTRWVLVLPASHNPGMAPGSSADEGGTVNHAF